MMPNQPHWNWEIESFVKFVYTSNVKEHVWNEHDLSFLYLLDHSNIFIPPLGQAVLPTQKANIWGGEVVTRVGINDIWVWQTKLRLTNTTISGGRLTCDKGKYKSYKGKMILSYLQQSFENQTDRKTWRTFVIILSYQKKLGKQSCFLKQWRQAKSKQTNLY